MYREKANAMQKVFKTPKFWAKFKSKQLKQRMLTLHVTKVQIMGPSITYLTSCYLFYSINNNNTKN